jgi:hypothetical protein
MDNNNCCNKSESSCHGGHCPPFMAKLPMDRKVTVVLGVLVFVLSVLASITYWTGFQWILAALGLAMIYGGYTGNCMLTCCMKKFCCEKGSCHTPPEGNPDDKMV